MMKLIRYFVLTLMICLSLTAFSQTAVEEPVWYLDEVVSSEFINRYDFEYYYQPSAADMEQQRRKGEASYFLNSPEGLNSKKVRDLIDRIIASYDDIKALGDWHVTTGTYWKEFRHEKNKFRFTVKRKALDDGTYYVSVTESANYYKSLSKKDKEKEEATPEKPVKRHARDRKPVERKEVTTDVEQASLEGDGSDGDVHQPVLSEKERRRNARQREEQQRQEERLAKRQAQEEERAQKKALKQAEKERKAQEKQEQEESKRIKREKQRQQREQERQQKEKAAKATIAEKSKDSKYHWDDVALWLSEKYDFTQTAGDASSCAMYSTAIKDVEMAKLAIKNALKGSNARMAMPWRLNSETGAVETGYTVDDHVLVFIIGKDDAGTVNITVTEVSNDQFELFKETINN